MNVHLPAPRRGWPARLVILAVVVVVLALAAATFVLSYTGVHEIALQAGVSSRLARFYPGTFDAVLVIACAAAVVLRDAHWLARSYAWLSIILVVAVVGAADAVHAMNVVLPHRQMEGVVAAAPWVLALLGFSLLLTILQQTRAQHSAAAPESRRAARRAEKQRAGAAPRDKDEQSATLVVPGLAAPETGAPAAHRLDEPAAAVPVGAAQSYPPADISASAEGPPAIESGEPAPSWHQYWDMEGPGPASQGFPAPAAEAVQHGYPAPQADPAEPPDVAAHPPATGQTYPGAVSADPGEGSYRPAAGDPAEHAYRTAETDPGERGYRTTETDLGEGSYQAAEADPGQSGYPAREGNPRPVSYPAGEADPGQGGYPAGEGDPRPVSYPAGEADPGQGGYPAGEGDPRPVSYPAGEGDPRPVSYPADEVGPGQRGYPATGADRGQGSYPATETDSGEPYPTSATEAEPGYPPAGARQLDDDAPPFATAPFATVPRLNRVRSSPTPPEADEE